jgi:hypothetical protein
MRDVPLSTQGRNHTAWKQALQGEQGKVPTEMKKYVREKTRMSEIGAMTLESVIRH